MSTFAPQVIGRIKPTQQKGLQLGESWKRIIVVSNRLPYKVVSEGGRKPVAVASSGGLVTAMTPLLQSGVAGRWVGWPGSEGVHLDDALQGPHGTAFEIGIVALSHEEIRQYYLGFANEVLAPLLLGHEEKVDHEKARDCWAVYWNVQKKFADKVHECVTSEDIIWVQDYHLIGVADELRKKGVRQPIGFFLHSHAPFPERLDLPIPQKGVLMRAFLAYDLIGFQTRAFRQRFIAALRALVPDARVGREIGGATEIIYRGHTTRVGHFPISIDADEFERQLYAADTQNNVRRLHALRKKAGGKMIFNAGRQDYGKGFLEELLAFDLLLEKHPSLVASTQLVQLVIPSRGIGANREYKRMIESRARSLNCKYRRRVVRQLYTSMGRARYIAHLREADVQCIPTLADGMNLIAKEHAIVGHPASVQVLGQNAGVVEAFGEHALVVDPKDTERFADALYDALTMDEHERHRRKSALKASVTANDVFGWWSNAQEGLFKKAWHDLRS